MGNSVTRRMVVAALYYYYYSFITFRIYYGNSILFFSSASIPRPRCHVPLRERYIPLDSNRPRITDVCLFVKCASKTGQSTGFVGQQLTFCCWRFLTVFLIQIGGNSGKIEGKTGLIWGLDPRYNSTPDRGPSLSIRGRRGADRLAFRARAVDLSVRVFATFPLFSCSGFFDKLSSFLSSRECTFTFTTILGYSIRVPPLSCFDTVNKCLTPLNFKVTF